MKRAVPVSLALALAASLASAAPAAADDDPMSFPLDGGAPTEAAQGAQVDARVGNLTSRPIYPGTGARRLESAKVRQDLPAARISGTFVLDAQPTAASTSYLRVNFGHLQGDDCVGDVAVASPTASPAAGFSRSGRTITMNVSESQAGYEDWNCAFAALTDDLQVPPTTTYSVLIGALRNIYAKPDLRIRAPELLRSKKIRLVRGVWTTLEVSVKNVGSAGAGRMTLTGRGKGLRVKQARGRYPLSAGSTDTVRVKVQLVKKLRKTRLKLVGRASGVTARRAADVRRISPPARPKPGAYASDGVKFRITAGRTPKVTGFRVYARTTCGGYPDIPIITMNHYDFPTTKIGRNGIVDRVVHADLYTVRLQLLVRGGKVTRGYFWYGGPNRCWAVKTFTASRR